MKYFTLEDCTRSATATTKGIDNTPNAEHTAHILESKETLIDPLREAWGQYCSSVGLGSPGIHVSSGYRGPALNAAVHGPNTSAHCYGYAFDLIPVNGEMIKFKHFCREFLSHHPFDQMISEKENKKGVPNWIHIGYKHPDGRQRGEFLTMINGNYFPMTD